MAKYVGFANLPSQVHRKTVKRGFEFTLMVVGESGLGKSTLINSLFLTDLYAARSVPSAKERISSTLEIETSCVEIEEQGIRLKLTVVDTPGFADSLDSSNCFQPIVNYVDSQFEHYLRDESGLNRRNIADNRVHCCFYFVNSSGHGLRPIDIRFMKLLHERVNIVPVIGKSDTLTKKELQALKAKVLSEIQSNGIKMYAFPEGEDEEDEDFVALTKQLKAAVPMAVIGSNVTTMKDGKKIRGRQYPWGIVNIEDPTHCDFVHLRTLLITFMQDMKEVTQEVHYENFRAQRLNTPGKDSPLLGRRADDPMVGVNVGARKGSSSSVGVIDDKDELLKQKERELQQMQEMIAKMQAQMQMNNNNNLQAPNANPEKTSTL